MGDLSKHFSAREFTCKCGKCYKSDVKPDLITMLEKLHDLMGAHEIIITSGYRCSEWSLAVGGYANDAHTKGIAADIKVSFCDDDGVVRYYNSELIAEAAERVGFSGIGIIDNTACHVDIRNDSNYVNSHWFGNEMTHNDNIETFQKGTKFVSRETTNTLEIMLNGKSIYKGEIKV